MVSAKIKIGEQLMREGIIDLQQLTRAVEEQKKSGALMGKVLVKLGMVKEDLLQEFLERQMRSRDSRRLGEVLVDEHHITQAQLDAALEMSQRSGQKLGHVLVKKGFIAEFDLIKILSAQMNIGSINLDDVDFNSSLMALLSEEDCKLYRVMPIEANTQRLKLAMTDPSDIKAIDIIRFKTSREIEPYMATDKAITEAIERVYRRREHVSRNSKDGMLIALEKMFEAQKLTVDMQEKIMQQQRTILATLQDLLYNARSNCKPN